jgi:hypothetical protein
MRAALAVLVISLTIACSRPEPGFDGIGPWHVGKTTMKDAVRCDPPGAAEPDLHWCYLNPEQTLAGQRATVDLYFRGTGDAAPLAEVLVAVGRCKVEALDRFLASKLGPAPESHGQTFVWKQPTATIVARLPSAPNECQIHFLAPGETRRLAALTGAAPAPATTPAAASTPSSP